MAKQLLLITFLVIMIPACQQKSISTKSPDDSQQQGIQFSGKEKYGLLLLTISQKGKYNTGIDLVLKNKKGEVAGVIKQPLLNTSTGLNASVFGHSIFRNSRIYLIKLDPGIYTLSHRYKGMPLRQNVNSNHALHFRIYPGLTAYLGNIKFDLRYRGAVRFSVQDKIQRDMGLVRTLHPGINYLTFDRQVPSVHLSKKTMLIY